MPLVKSLKNFRRQLSEYQGKLSELDESKKILIIVKVMQQPATYMSFLTLVLLVKMFIKIGVTRRLEPLERIRELSSASVPFQFDVHALIFSEEAFALETELHNQLSEYKVNKVNNRKEYFKVPFKKN